MEKSEAKKSKLSPLMWSFIQLLAIFVAQFAVMWLVGRVFPDIACSAYADPSCKPQPTTEGLLLHALLPLVFIPFALMKFKQIVMYAGALVPVKKLMVIFISVSILIIMTWQLFAALGALLGRWFG
jgi:hypothetical protein